MGGVLGELTPVCSGVCCGPPFLFVSELNNFAIVFNKAHPNMVAHPCNPSAQGLKGIFSHTV